MFFISVGMSGANHDHRIQGHVADRITGDPIPAKIFLMDADSTVIDTTTAVLEDSQIPYLGKEAWYVFNGKINQRGRYIIKAVMPDYKDAYVNCELKSQRQSAVHVETIFMERDYHELPEVTVKATKIKMVMRGDTIVYNADAFNLAEGSMLDALISRLPGAQLTKAGEIFVNGKRIQSLLLNGRDFFSGNPKLALENLPAYTVNKIKVYDREGDVSRLMGRSMGDESYVMDVKLKKEYDATIFGNVEAGVGTKERFLLKGMSMKTSQKEILMAFANVNNLNDNQKTDAFGQWAPQETPKGLLVNREANITYARFFDSDMAKWISTQNTISHNDGDFQTVKNTEIFLPGGNLSKRLQGGMNNKATVFDSQNAFQYGESSKYTTKTDLKFNYKRDEEYSHDDSSSSDAISLLNELIEKSTFKSENYHVAFNNYNDLVNITDLLRMEIGAEYDRKKDQRFSLYDLRYSDADTPRDFRNNYLQFDSRHWDLKGAVSYDWQWPGWGIRPEYQYNHKYNKTNNGLYRLDKLEDRDHSHYDLLPSAKAALLSVIDDNNSYSYAEYQNHHRAILEWSVNAASGPNHLNIDYGYIRLPLHMVNKSLYYTRLGRHDVSKHAVFLEPELYFRGGQKLYWELNASVKSEIPDLVQMADYRDDSDPLFIITGNPDLKNKHLYQASLLLRHEGARQRVWNVFLSYNQTDNDVAYATLYDMRTGVASMKPVSVNGNWRTEAKFDYTQALDSARRWTIDNKFSLRYNHNVDMTITYDLAASMRSVVNNWQFDDDLKLIFRSSDMCEFSLHAGGTYYYIHSKREGFDNIHAGDYHAGFATELQLPWHFSFGSDINMYARRGYQEHMMNTTEWVWNAHLHYSFLKDKMLAKLTCFDLLHQLSNTKYEMNSQGRTEVWYNSLPRYVTFSLAWKFNTISKKKNNSK